MLTTRLFLALAATTVLATPAFAQTLTTFDDFTGTSVDTTRWFVENQTVSQSNSRLRIDLAAVKNEEAWAGVIAYDIFDRDFEFVLDFDKLAATNTIGGSGFELGIGSARNPSVNGGWVNVELVNWIDGSTKQRVFRFNSWREDSNGEMEAKSQEFSNITAGQLRLTRSGTSVTASFKLPGQKSWTTIKTWLSPLTDFVEVEVQAWCGWDKQANDGKISVQCDKLAYTAKRYSAPVNYGPRCHDLIAFRHGLPFLGSKTFGIITWGDTPLASAPVVMILGLGSTPISLAAAGAPGCYLNTDMLILLSVGATNKEGFHLTSLPIPNDNNLLNLSVNVQTGVLKNVNNFGYALSNGVTVKAVKL